ncbi:hypothetical protein ACELLULO517_19125 [Acidisoma cellulosilytica]|uniref:DUF5666 domain-containing protein n=1 Tax=Acidisoma cellulosilyticum TaxID=2802395 RepID=A0A963Z5U3_9PROT|nr:hypothetical protein [Acidisoma cellulosilyticum]MCB8882368.1 hypothetical protein [Acidisoma cellulosilyticum]
MRQTFIATAAMGLALLGGIALAQAAAPKRVRGTVTAITATEISITTRSGAAETFALTADTHYLGETTGAMTDIKSGSYIGSAAVPVAGGGGKLRAVEVTVFPPSMVGVGEGHYDWDLGKNSSMTNGTVGDLVTSNGNTMMVKYKGGEKAIVVPADVPIVTIAPGAMTEVTSGVKVIVVPAKGDAKTAAAVLFGRNGITPPQ